MPILKDIRQERMAQALAKGCTNEEAMAEAGMTANKRNGWAYRNRHPEIDERIRELQEEAVERHKVTVDDIIRELDEARQLALGTNKAAAAVSATMGKAKILGLEIDRSEVKLSNPDGSLAMPREIKVIGVKPE